MNPSVLPSPCLSPRANTSVTEQLPHGDPFLSTGEQEEVPQMHRPVDKPAESKTEIATARSRLKSITGSKTQEQHGPPVRSHTIAELNNMIDDAIQEHAADAPTETSADISEQASPQPTVIRRWRSERSSRPSVEDIEFHPPDVLGKSRSQSRPRTSHGTSNILTQSPRQNWLLPNKSHSRPRPDAALRGASPVKQRAAMFETMDRTPEQPPQADGAPSEAHIHVKREWAVVPLHNYTADAEKDHHHLKFGTTIYEPPKTTESALSSSPERTDRRQSTESSRATQTTFNTAAQSPLPDTTPAKEQTTPTRSPETGSRRTSISWLNKSRLLNKGSSATPQTNEGASEVAPRRDENYQLTRPSIVKSKVQELLKRDEEEQIRRQSVQERKSRPSTRRSTMVQERELAVSAPETFEMKAALLPPLQVPAQEEAELMATPWEMAWKSSLQGQGKTATAEPDTQVNRSWAEKEVLSISKSQPQAGTSRSGSPIKPTPSTPVRGRREKTRQSLSARGSPYTREQAFVLSPVPSRSPSRGSSRVRVQRVEVEMRDSPEREARERGESILIVRACGIVEEDQE